MNETAARDVVERMLETARTIFDRGGEPLPALAVVRDGAPVANVIIPGWSSAAERTAYLVEVALLVAKLRADAVAMLTDGYHRTDIPLDEVGTGPARDDPRASESIVVMYLDASGESLLAALDYGYDDRGARRFAGTRWYPCTPGELVGPAASILSMALTVEAQESARRGALSLTALVGLLSDIGFGVLLYDDA